ncbi:hypothetical protein [Mycolicibacterium pyrenivorans]|uniref:hypothetical protein n=1 Tax=Mycolicibacterium pyrenivorans TaxID=187102 RepID=UPI0021F3677C|nr:hypothetical protein [Mycolicibacterium pyrenivorans]
MVSGLGFGGADVDDALPEARLIDAGMAARSARTLVPHAQVQVYRDASHAINGEYADEIADHAHRFWDAVDS